MCDEYNGNDSEDECDVGNFWAWKRPPISESDSRKATCKGICGKKYSMMTLGKFNGRCSRCNDAWMLQNGGAYAEKNWQKHGFYQRYVAQDSSESDSEDEKQVTEQEEKRGSSWSQRDMDAVRKLFETAIDEKEEEAQGPTLRKRKAELDEIDLEDAADWSDSDTEHENKKQNAKKKETQNKLDEIDLEDTADWTDSECEDEPSKKQNRKKAIATKTLKGQRKHKKQKQQKKRKQAQVRKSTINEQPRKRRRIIISDDENE